MIPRYFLKLKNNEKLEVTQDVYNEWLHMNKDYITFVSFKGNRPVNIQIKREDIILGLFFETE